MGTGRRAARLGRGGRGRPRRRVGPGRGALAGGPCSPAGDVGSGGSGGVAAAGFRARSCVGSGARPPCPAGPRLGLAGDARRARGDAWRRERRGGVRELPHRGLVRELPRRGRGGGGGPPGGLPGASRAGRGDGHGGLRALPRAEPLLPELSPGGGADERDRRSPARVRGGAPAGVARCGRPRSCGTSGPDGVRVVPRGAGLRAVPRLRVAARCVIRGQVRGDVACGRADVRDVPRRNELVAAGAAARAAFVRRSLSTGGRGRGRAERHPAPSGA